ncbi:P-loop containing nucleoside triphosphate hydrolase protein [Ascobolus immersus RN42]|uniref:DNA 3'-5' helicase n=1 Tax=Ascobolus immersus RN42 TaxID=1160509 RepID=A0A3N4IIJ5_ASCIM|nr:P-loop containing nucleoside triphosphate hydrolase protein [Ascobolus immersus RN42]
MCLGASNNDLYDDGWDKDEFDELVRQAEEQARASADEFGEDWDPEILDEISRLADLASRPETDPAPSVNVTAHTDSRTTRDARIHYGVGGGEGTHAPTGQPTTSAPQPLRIPGQEEQWRKFMGRDTTMWKDISNFDMSSPEARKNSRIMDQFIKNKKPFSMRDWQLRDATAVSCGYDVVSVAPTGAGKSLLYQALCAFPDKTVIIISPLTELIDEQVEELNEMGIPTVAFTKDNLLANPHLWTEFETDPKFRCIVGSPEIFCKHGSRFWRGFRKDRKKHPFFSRTHCVVLDEGHMVYKWGGPSSEDGDPETAFRPDFQLIGNFKIGMPGVPFLVLSATMTLPVEVYVHKALGLQSPTFISRQPLYRHNIQLIMAGIQYRSDFRDLDFIIEDTDNIPHTMIYVDDRTKAQNIGRYLRKRLKDKGADPTLVALYTGYYDHKTRRMNMRRFRKKEAMILVCTEAAGMGINIKTVQLVVQYRIPDNLNLSDLMQRVGRAGRDENIEAAAIVFVDDKHILMDHTEPEKGKGRDFFLPITEETVLHSDRANDMLNSMFSSENRKTGSRLCPGLRLLFNTTGCRSRVHLAVLGDRRGALTFDPDAPISGCKCDNCWIPPQRSDIDRLIPPSCLTEGLYREGIKAIEQEELRKSLEQAHPEIVNQRRAAAQALRNTISGKVLPACPTFLPVRTLRYLDSAAKVEEQEAIRHETISTKAQARTKALAKKIASALLDTRTRLYHVYELGVKYKVIEPHILGQNMIDRVANSIELHRIGSSDLTQEKFLEIITGQLNLGDTILEDYADQFYASVKICLWETEEQTRKETERETAEIERQNRETTPLFDDIERRYRERSESRSRSGTPVSQPGSQPGSAPGTPNARFNNDGTQCQFDVDAFMEAGSDPEALRQQLQRWQYGHPEYEDYTREHLDSAGPLDYPVGIPPVLPPHTKRKRKYTMPWRNRDLFDFSIAKDVELWNSQVRLRIYDEECFRRQEERKRQQQREKAAREVQVLNERAAQRKRKRDEEPQGKGTGVKRRGRAPAGFVAVKPTAPATGRRGPTTG